MKGYPVVDISIENAQPGMVLSGDVSISGGVLLNKFETLDDNLISLLKNCGITTISIISNQDPATTQTSSPAPPADQPGDHTPFVIPPEIEISISPDSMSAHITLKPVHSVNSVITEQVIVDALHSRAIVYGIHHTQIQELVTKWNTEAKQYEAASIAEGTPATPSVEGAITMVVSHLSNQVDVEKVKQIRFYGEALLAFPFIEHISSGSAIALRNTHHATINGTTILGQIIEPSAEPISDIALGQNVQFTNDNQKIIALCDGIAYKCDRTVGVIQTSPDGSFSIAIAPDNMSVTCTVIPPGPGGTLPDKKSLLAMLQSVSVYYGIKDNDIDTLLSLCQQGAYPQEPFIVARGLTPIRGEDGGFIYHFDNDTSLAPKINDDGSADYKSVNIVTTANKGQKLVTLVPPGNGHDGSDVLGKAIPAQKGTPAKLPQGPHTTIDPQNESTLIAETEGIVRQSGGLVEICEGFLVEGDVDYSTGNITFNKTIQVNGDVKSGFTIHAGGDLQVNGTIEDCHITVGGNVLGRYGFLGQGKGCIEAKGDVNLGFIKNQCVKSFKTISIAKEAISSNLYSRSRIIIHGRPLSAAGGELHAKNELSVYSVGNHTGIRTLLEVGVDFLMVDELTMIEKQIAEATEQFKLVADSFSRYQKNMHTKKHLSPQEQIKFKELTNIFKRARQKLTVLEERQKIVSGKMYSIADARITIEHNAFPGTLLKFGDRHHLLKEELIGPKTIIYSEHDIKIC